jgi:hypothetical protein
MLIPKSYLVCILYATIGMQCDKNWLVQINYNGKVHSAYEQMHSSGITDWSPQPVGNKTILAALISLLWFDV